MTKPGAVAWFGATILWTGAATLSFAGLDGLAVSCYIAPGLAPLLPLVIDVGVAVAAWVWRRGVNPEASRLAGRMTWSLLVLTVLGNGSHLGMEAGHVTPPWWCAALVGAIPPAVAGAVAHLLVLLARTADVALLDTCGHDEEPDLIPAEIPAPPTQPPSVPRSPDNLLSKTEQLLPIGRRALAQQLDISEHKARELLLRATPREDV